MNHPSFPPSKARILIVDDHPMVREGLAMHIATQGDMEVCGEADNTASALSLLESTRPDLIVVDISLKDSNGMDLIRRIRDREENLRILVWSMYPENLYAERALRAGAKGYLNKSRATRELMDAIRSVLNGKTYVSGDFAESILLQIGNGKDGTTLQIECLSDRELQAFEMIGHGMTTEAIATKMQVSSKTIETYRMRIKQKLGIKHASELVQRAAQWVLEIQSGRTRDSVSNSA
jgi:DNA-binding NarL/FixJ family response regulator